MYRLRLRPWEIDADPPELVAAATAPREVRGQASPRALDLGCGSGRQSLLLARHGWDVVGVDFVEQAVHTARQRLSEAGLPGRFVVGDVRRLDELDLGGPFDLVLDLKCFHGLKAPDRERYVRAVASVVTPGGTYLLFALPPSTTRRLLGAPAGVGQQEVAELFEADFTMVGAGRRSAGLFTPVAYRMRRRGALGAQTDQAPDRP
ncbi:hypothetical protein GCM10027053_00570 [Intrasporangium mesophilum]